MLFLASEIVWPVNVNTTEQKGNVKKWNRLVHTIMIVIFCSTLIVFGGGD